MKKIMTLFGTFIFASFVLVSCSNNSNSGGAGMKTVGDWYCDINKNMGGSQISSTTKLTIIRNGPGDYDYQLSVTVVDQMFGGQPKTEYSNGKLEGTSKNDQWRFIGGDFGNRGAYIIIPSDKWENYPTDITIRFFSGRGNTMTFRR